MIECLGNAGALLGLVAHRVGQRRQAADLALLPGCELGPALLVGHPRGAVLRVGALVFDELALIEMQHPRERGVEQFDVVAHHEQRTPIGAQEAHQPLLGVDVEVVRGLVEHERVAPREQDAGELHPTPLATRERVDGQVEAIGLEPEAGRDGPHL